MTAKSTNGRPGIPYTLKQIELPNGDVVTREAIVSLSQTKQGGRKLMGMIQEVWCLHNDTIPWRKLHQYRNICHVHMILE